MAAAAKNARGIFLAAVELATPAERAAYLDDSCAGDVALRQRVEALLRANDEAGAFLSEAKPDSNATVTHVPAATLVGADIAGRYKLIEEIGDGGMGTVWMAEQREPVKRLVAIKLIKAGMDSKAVLARFEAERQALALMDHPNIAKVLDGGTTDDGKPFFVMELVKGLPLTEYCDARRLSVPDRLNLFVQICSAVQHAHQKAVIHRDLKPTNVLVTEHDGMPVPKVIDFGLAKALNASQMLTQRTLHTAYGAVVGTPLYMAPEQVGINALDVDTRTDIYSLGVILYELLAGSTPLEKARFKEAAWDEVKRLIREEEPPRPSTRLSSSASLPSLAANRQAEPAKLSRLVRGELDWIVMKALEKDRSRRYETANGFARDIQRYLADEIVEARPPSTGYRLKKFVRRYRTAIGTSGSFVFVLAAGTVVSLIHATRATLAEHNAIVSRVQADEQRQEADLARQREMERADGERQAKERANAAEQVAKANAATAVEERKISHAINQFFQNDILRQADVHLQQVDQFQDVNPNLTVREALDRASEQIENRFHGQPNLEASVRIAIAEGYLGVGDANRAILHLERCQSIYAVRLDAAHPEVFRVRRLLATAYLAAHRGREARILCEEMLPLVRSRHGNTHDESLRLTNILGIAYLDTNATKKAVELFEELRRLDDTRPAKDKSNYAIWNNLAIAYELSGRLSDAQQLHDQCLAQRRTALGPDHLDTLMSMNNLGTLFWKSGKLDRSIPLFEEAVRLRKVKLGAGHPLSIRTLTNLGINYLDAGRLREAIAVFEEAEQLGRKLSDPEIVHIDHITQSLAEAYSDAGEHAKAEPRFRSVLDGVRSKTGPQSPATASWSARLGLNLLNQKRWDEAEQFIRDSLKVREPLEPDSWATFNTYSLLGGVMLGQKKHTDAEPLLLKGYRGMKEREVKIPKDAVARLTESLDRLIELYTATNKPDEVKKWQAERAKYPVAEAKQPGKK